jgi:predicted Zn finger-like uncharacterized protein
MYTLCQACRTVFHITAAELRAADGTVVCGACGVTFNALETLSETRPTDPPPAPATATPAVRSEEAPAAELARDEDEFLEELESLIGSETEEVSEPEIRLSHGRVEPPAEADLDDAAVTPIDDAFDDVFDHALDDALDEGPGAALDQEPDEHLDDRIPDPDSVFRVDDLPDELDVDRDEQPFVSDNGVEDDRAGDYEERHEDEPADQAGELPRDAKLPAITTGDGADDLDPHDLDDERGPEPTEETEREDQRVDTADLDGLVGAVRRRRAWPKVLVGLLLALVLFGTWVHSQHGKLLRNPAVESLLAPVYGMLGIAAAPDWDPAAFRALQWEAVADVDRPGHLTVAVDFQNSAPFDQPFPIIRIVLEDRFGRRLGTHDLAPSEYRDDHSPGERLPAGARLRTTLMVPDPSARADGFRVDFCLEMATKGLVCGPQTFR